MDMKDFASADAMTLGTVCTEMGTRMTDFVMQSIERFGVDESWFHDPRHRKFFTAVRETWKEHRALDLFMVKAKFVAEVQEHGDAVFATLYEELMDVSPVTTHLEFYLQALKQKAIYGKLHKLLNETMRDLNPDNVGMMLESCAKSLRSLQDDLALADGGLTQLGDYFEQSVAKKKRLHEERFVKHNWEYLEGLPWPWKEVDQIFSGLKTGLHILAALASQGKSTMAVNLSVFWNMRGIKHGFFSIDMAADQLADRYPCVMNRVSLAKLNFGGSGRDVDGFIEGFNKCISYNNVWLSEEDDAAQMEYQCFRGVKTLGWQAIIIDYIQLVTADEQGNMPEYTRVQRVVQAVKRIAKRLKVPVVCLAQLSRAFEKELREKGFAPGLDAIGDSAEIARAASSVTCLYQDEDMRRYWETHPPTQLAFGDRYNVAPRYHEVNVGEETEQEHMQRINGQTALAKTLRPIWFDVKKNQQGRCGKLPFVMYPNYFLFRPGNSDGKPTFAKVNERDSKEKELPIEKFEQIRDDWTYTQQDWWLEMTGAMPQRGCKLMGETIAEMKERMAKERTKHPEVDHFVKWRDEKGFEQYEHIRATAPGGQS